MRSRTEEQILTQAPVKVKLGDKEYDLKPLRLKKQWAWRTLFMDTVNQIFPDKEGDAAAVKEGVGVLLKQYPEKVMDLICAFAPDLPRATVEEDATEEQVLLCFQEIYALAILPIVAQAAAMKTAAAVLSQ